MPVGKVHIDTEISIQEVERHCIIIRLDSASNHFDHCHFETLSSNEFVERFHVKDGAEFPVLFQDKKNVSIKTYACGNSFNGLFMNERLEYSCFKRANSQGGNPLTGVRCIAQLNKSGRSVKFQMNASH